MTRTLDRETRRAELVSAAAALFAERGVANTAVSDIVKAAGVAQGTFYLYFGCKDDAVLAVVEQMVGTIIESASARVESQNSAVERLRALTAVLSEVAEAPDSVELADMMNRPENRALHARLAEDMAPRLAGLVESIVVQGVAEGVFDVDDPAAAAWFVLGGLQSVELAGTPPAQMPDSLSLATGLALRALGYRETRP